MLPNRVALGFCGCGWTLAAGGYGDRPEPGQQLFFTAIFGNGSFWITDPHERALLLAFGENSQFRCELTGVSSDVLANTNEPNSVIDN